MKVLDPFLGLELHRGKHNKVKTHIMLRIWKGGGNLDRLIRNCPTERTAWPTVKQKDQQFYAF